MSIAINDAIETNATGPKQVSADGVTVTQHSIAEQIAASKHSGSVRASSEPPFGLKIAKLVPHGAV